MVVLYSLRRVLSDRKTRKVSPGPSVLSSRNRPDHGPDLQKWGILGLEVVRPTPGPLTEHHRDNSYLTVADSLRDTVSTDVDDGGVTSLIGP